MTEEIIVSVIIPLFNEERYVSNLIDSLTKQTYPIENMEWIFVDGNSSDGTVTLIENYISTGKYPIILFHNKKRKTPYALNMAIEEAKGKYIIRLDAHSYFYPDYIEKCVYYLDTTDADNVGGIAETEATGFKGQAIAKMLSTKLGVGGSDFRVGDGNCFVDTVPFGAFRREVFERVGLFNPKLLRSEDNDMNARIRQSGGKIWLAEDIRFKYYCRDTFKGILKMALQNGNALFFTLKENPKAMSVRHFVPFLFLLSLIVMPILSIVVPYIGYIFMLEILLYLSIDVFYSFFNKTPQYGLITLWLYPAFHIVYGLGSLLGLFGISLY
ncbi:MAG: glycosyltransferase family 2 protein [Clostridia bacterium]|nr:glycosyltransferase family 2 protein [Clostridia bacterium]